MLDEERRVFLRIFSKYRNFIPRSLKSMYPHKISKSVEISEDAREKGNELFKLKKHDDAIHALILEQYCKSIAFAPAASVQMLLAIMNRSAFLIHIGKYEESLNDIEKALKLCKDNELQRGKLLCRQLHCLKQLGYTAAYETVLEKVESWVGNIKNDRVKTDVEDLMKEAKKGRVNNNLSLKDKKAKTVDDISSKTRCTMNSVAIKFDPKQGRHLVATKNFNPGEIIFTEKSFVFMRDLKAKYTHCNYCLQICWSSLPCDNCTWASFCSETCKKHACTEFHDVECAVLPDATDFYEICGPHREKYHLWVRMLTIGIRKAGGISKLIAELESRNKLGDISAETYFHDGKLGNYSLADVIVLNNEYNYPNFETLENPCCSYIPPIFVYFVKNSPFFEGVEKIDKIEELLKRNDVKLVGSLFVKFAKMKPQLSADKFKACNEVMCGKQNTYFAPFLSLVSHSCCPNADSRCYNNYSKWSQHMEGIVYAVQPIQAGSKISVSYVGQFYHSTKKQRQEQLKLYNIDCDCEACNHDWPELLNPNIPTEIDRIYLLNLKRDAAMKPFTETMQFVQYLQRKHRGFVCDQKSFDKISKTITLAVALLEKPSMILCFLVEALREAFTSIHCVKEDQPFGSCRKQSKTE